ncbi:alpha/beta hydrolase [Altererythrobacter xixiisoli]|uniref:Alpha/beta hydrolase n=1 Tax=Croceibacterium xixiisoli TaxID=1476466 RepID=A0A6I4U142_9SPHN|nr:alpha/beta hydrolase-fold protein [Croceibacterium xixiisoli]MXP00384.1 alpha/beta hydrolase [Croceibacterium xixiisoli]
MLPGIAGDYFPLDSSSVGRRFHIFVKLPESYGTDPARTYPVSILLDGDTTYPMIAPQSLLMVYDEGVPETIVVGVAYGGLGADVNKRHIDFSVALDDGTPGGAPAFLQMLEDELLPQIAARYRVDPTPLMLFGQSRGGAFALYAAHQRPSLFQTYVASNPSREANGRLYDLEHPPGAARSQSRLVIVSGTRDRPPLRAAAEQWAAGMAGRTDLPWQAELVSIEGGTHSASAGRAYRAGLLRAFGLPALSP